MSGLWDNEMQDDEGNPLGGVYKAVNFMQKLSSTPLAAFKWAGGKVKEFIDQYNARYFVSENHAIL